MVINDSVASMVYTSGFIARTRNLIDCTPGFLSRQSLVVLIVRNGTFAQFVVCFIGADGLGSEVGARSSNCFSLLMLHSNRLSASSAFLSTSLKKLTLQSRMVLRNSCVSGLTTSERWQPPSSELTGQSGTWSLYRFPGRIGKRSRPLCPWSLSPS